MSRIEGSYPPPVRGVSTLAPRNRAEGYASLQENCRSDPVHKLKKRPRVDWVGKVPFASGDTKVHMYRRDGVSYKLFSTNGIISGTRDNEPLSVIGTPAYLSTVEKELEFVTINDTTFVINPEIPVEMLPDTDELDVERVSYINVLSALNYSETIRVNINRSGSLIATVSYTVPALGTSNPDYDTADAARATRQVAFKLAQLINSSPITYPNPAYNYDWTVCSPVNVPLEGYDNVQITQAIYRNVWVKNPNYNPTALQCIPYIESTGGVAGITAQFLGSSVAVWSDDGEWLDLTIETGQGDRSAVAINEEIEKVDGLPLYAVHGTRIKVEPDPTSDKGIYYLEARGTADTATTAPTPASRKMEEVVWVETRSPYEPYKWDKDTLPHTIVFEEFNIRVSTPSVGWADRETGDNNTNEPPTFLGKPIRSAGYFQNRLVLISDDTVHMTKTDNLYDWWKDSAVRLLASDPVNITSSAAGADKLNYVVPHNRDLLAISASSQFKVSGEVAITPTTSALQLTASYNSQPSTAPISMGNSVYFPISYGDSTGVQEYTGQADTQQDTANQITQHVKGYISGNCKRLVGNANIGIIVALADGMAQNELAVYEQNTNQNGEKTQAAWSKWLLPEDVNILDVGFENTTLIVVGSINEVVYVYEMELEENLDPERIYLDNAVTLPVVTNGPNQGIIIANDYQALDGAVIVTSTGTEYPLTEVAYAPLVSNPNFLVFDEWVVEEGVPATVVLGNKYTSRYSPTRPYKRDENGITVTSDKLRIAKFTVNLQDTVTCNMKVTSDYYEESVQEFSSRLVGGIGNLIGKITPYTGDIEFSYGEDPDLSDVEFYSDDYLGFNILGLSWSGQYKQTSGRI